MTTKTISKLATGVFTAHKLVEVAGKTYLAPSFVVFVPVRGWSIRRRPKIVDGKPKPNITVCKTFREACALAESYRPLLEDHVPFSGVYTVKRSGLKRVSRANKAKCCFLFNSLFIEHVRSLEKSGVVMPEPKYAEYLRMVTHSQNQFMDLQLIDLIELHGVEIDLYVVVRADQRPAPIQDKHFNLMDLVKDPRWARTVWSREKSFSPEDRPAYLIRKAELKGLATFKAFPGTQWVTPVKFPRPAPPTQVIDSEPKIITQTGHDNG